MEGFRKLGLVFIRFAQSPHPVHQTVLLAFNGNGSPASPSEEAMTLMGDRELVVMIRSFSVGKEQAKHLRNNSTSPEVYLWNQLKQDQIGFQFRRQYCLGPYIFDLYCPDVKLNVEIDGRKHHLKQASDAIRDRYAENEGITVLRIRQGTSTEMLLRSL